MPQTQAQRDWYDRNKELAIKRARVWKDNNPDKAKESSRLYNIKYRDRISASDKELYQYMRSNRPDKLLFDAARKRARDRGKEFTIELSDVIVPEFCPILGIPLFKSNTKTQGDNSPTLDRFDNNLGYIKGNVNVISWKANRIKNNATPEEVRKVADWLQNVQH